MKKEYYDKKSFNKILSKVDKKSRAMPRVKKLMKEIDVLSKKAEPGSTADKKKGIAIQIKVKLDAIAAEIMSVGNDFKNGQDIQKISNTSASEIKENKGKGMKLIDRLVQSYTRMDEARVKDNDRWNGNDEIATMNFIYKDFQKELGRDPGKPYMDDDELVVGSKTVLRMKPNTTVADMKKAVAAWAWKHQSQKNAKAAAGETKFGRFSVKLPTELGGVLGNKATKLEKPRAVLKTDVDSAKEIQKVVKGKGVKFRMMKRKDHVAVYLDFDDGKLMKDALAKVAKIK